MSEVYNQAYYHSGCGSIPYEEPEHWEKFFGLIADRIVADLNPSTVLDAGCAMGYLVAALRDRGVEAYGIDISTYAISKVREDIRPYCAQCSLLEPLPASFPKHFDLVTNIEVLEHLEMEDGFLAIQNICSYTDQVLFSSTPSDYEEPTHVNVQQREYWAAAFAKQGLWDDLKYRPTYLTEHAILFRRSNDLSMQFTMYERNLRLTEKSIKHQILEWKGAVNDKLEEIAKLNKEREKIQADHESTIQEFNKEKETLLNELQEIKQDKAQVQAELQNERDDHQNERDEHAKEKNIQENEINKLKASVEKAQCKLRQADEKQQAEKEKYEAALADLADKNLKNEQQSASIIQQDKEAYAQLQESFDQIKKACTFYQYNNECLLTSTSWKITKPARSINYAMKNVFIKCKPVYLFAKGVKSVVVHGPKKTWVRVQQHFHTQKVQIDTVSPEKGIVQGDIKFSILVPLYNTDQRLLEEMLDSVLQQTYTNWELCLADGSDAAHAYVKTVCLQRAEKDGRIRYVQLEKNEGIANNTNACAKIATGDYIVLFDHDDLLSQDALQRNAQAIQTTDADVLYSDEDHVSVNGEHINPLFKPDWSPDLLYSQMYICHLLVIRKALFDEIEGFRSAYDGSQDYDLMLRLSEKTSQICHIPQILYSWRESKNSTASNADAKPYANEAGRSALDAHLKRIYGPEAHADDSEYLFVFDARFPMKEKALISIIIPMKDHCELTDRCIESILEKSTYQNYEILILNNRSENADTFAWLKQIQKRDDRISVIEADMPFNWSKLNNLGIAHARGDVYVFLNNDTVVISPDWLERLAENALRSEVGVVGGLLLYEDQTIQHAGVVVGFGGWADHVYKGTKPIHYASPYISPMVSRNVLAVTGACMAVSKDTINQIGGFDESFIICGSDVELCIRAYEAGLFNRYDANVRLYHLESKSRDSYIPDQDFERSYAVYGAYRENIDPFYNVNLDLNSTTPKEKAMNEKVINFKNYLKRNPLTARLYHAAAAFVNGPADNTKIPEIEPLHARRDSVECKGVRINLLVPSVDKKHVFGGIATAIKLFEMICEEYSCEARIICMDAPIDSKEMAISDKYIVVQSSNDSDEAYQAVAFCDRYNKTIPVRKNDYFLATAWWSAYTILDIVKWQMTEYNQDVLPLIYLIQDYEPGFYAWSSRYVMADSTYHMRIPVLAMFNSSELKDFMDDQQGNFEKAWYFEPVLNEKLRPFLPENHTIVKKDKKIIVYGRPGTMRNAFELLVASLRAWVEQYAKASDWEIYSAGEKFENIDLGRGVTLRSLGKLTLEEYAATMLSAYAGISLMVSPHPSYPPLEMATFGIRTITNRYGNKELSHFSDNIVSLDVCSVESIVEKLTGLCDVYKGTGEIAYREDYANGDGMAKSMVGELVNYLKQRGE